MFGTQRLGFRGQDLLWRINDFDFKVQGLGAGFRVLGSGLWLRVQGWVPRD